MAWTDSFTGTWDNLRCRTCRCYLNNCSYRCGCTNTDCPCQFRRYLDQVTPGMTIMASCAGIHDGQALDVEFISAPDADGLVTIHGTTPYGPASYEWHPDNPVTLYTDDIRDLETLVVMTEQDRLLGTRKD